MSVPAAPRERFEGIQVLRAVSVLLVVWTHMKYAGDFSQVAWVMNSVGAVGVDIFFVISGFVICLSARSMGFDARRFFVARFTRIVPIYWLTSVPLILMAVAKGKWDWAAVTSTFTFLPLLDFVHFTDPVNGFAWTLGYEFWFYSIVAAGMVLRGGRLWASLFAFLVAGMLLVPLFYDGAYLLPRFLFSPLLLEFFLGVVICTWRHRLGVKSLVFFTVGSAIFLVQLFARPDLGDWGRTLEGGLRRVYFFGGVGFFLVAAVVAAERLGFKRWPAWAIGIGEASYSIYILQVYALWLAANAGRSFGLPLWACGTIFVCSNLLLGLLSTRHLEVPLTRWVRSRWAGRTPAAEAIYRRS